MDYLNKYQQRFENYYPNQLPTSDHHLGKVFDSINYSFSAGGKRLRPALVYALAESMNISLHKVDDIALAIESIHTYSLIHDDLPAMDDDDLRRGKLSCHKYFDEATAILAGDALNTFAFEILSNPCPHNIKSEYRLRQINELAKCAGIHGMIGGQDIDLYSENNNRQFNLTELSLLHTKKTGKIIEACLTMAYLASDDICNTKLAALANIGQTLGLFYQIQDDVLDVTQATHILGKPNNSDINNKKLTYISLLGLEGAKKQKETISCKLNSLLVQFFVNKENYQNTPLSSIIERIFERIH